MSREKFIYPEPPEVNMALDDILINVRRTAGDTIMAGGIAAGASMLAEKYLENSTGSDPLVSLLEVGCGVVGGYLIKKAIFGNYGITKRKKSLIDRGIGTTAVTIAGNVYALSDIVDFLSNQDSGYTQALIATGLGAGVYAANKVVPPIVEYVGKLIGKILPKKNSLEALKGFALAASLAYAGVIGTGYVRESSLEDKIDSGVRYLRNLFNGNISSDYNTKVDYDNQVIKTLIEKSKFDQGFLDSLESMCGRLNMNCMAVLSVMHYETGGSFRPDIKNPNSSATGLIQFMGSTARKLETTTEDLSKMSQVEQLKYVENYFNLIKDNFDEVDYLNPKNVALAVFYPRAIGQGDDYVIAEDGRSKLDDRILKVNKDHNGDGKITADEYTGKSLGLGYLQ